MCISINIAVYLLGAEQTKKLKPMNFFCDNKEKNTHKNPNRIINITMNIMIIIIPHMNSDIILLFLYRQNKKSVCYQ